MSSKKGSLGAQNPTNIGQSGSRCAAQQRVRALVWWFYADLKAYCAAPTARRRSEMRTRFDRIFCRRTGFVTLTAPHIVGRE